MLAWPAKVTSSSTSASSNVLTSPRRSPTTSNPNVRSSPRSGATIASSSPRDCRNASKAWMARRRVSSVAEPIEATSANAAASPGENRSSGCISSSPSAPLTLRRGPPSSDGAREQDEHPQMRARVGRRGQRAEDQQRDAAAERQLGEIEGELGELAQLASAPVDDQRDERAGELPVQQCRRRCEQEAQCEPNLGQRQRVSLLAELEVDDEDFGEVEGKREPVPREGRGEPERGGIEAVDRDHPDDDARKGENGVEHPDAPRRAKRLARRSAEPAQDLARRAARDGEGPDRDHRPFPLLISPSSPRAICYLTSCSSAPARSKP